MSTPTTDDLKKIMSGITIATEIFKRLTTRNIMALSTTGIFLYAVVYMIQNGDVIITTIENSAPEITLAGGIIIGTFVAIVKDVYTFFFRKAQKKESQV